MRGRQRRGHRRHARQDDDHRAGGLAAASGAGLDPLVLIGADTPAFAHGARLGDGPMVRRGRRVRPTLPALLARSGGRDQHRGRPPRLLPRPGRDPRRVSASWSSGCPTHGRLIVCADEPCAAALTTTGARETYGFAADADWRLDDYDAVPGRGSRFTLRANGRSWAVESPLVGEHNARNVAGGDRGGGLFRRRPAGVAGRAAGVRGPAAALRDARPAARHLARRRLRAPSDRSRGGAARGARRRPRVTCGSSSSRTPPTARRRCSTSSALPSATRSTR